VPFDRIFHETGLLRADRMRPEAITSFSDIEHPGLLDIKFELNPSQLKQKFVYNYESAYLLFTLRGRTYPWRPMLVILIMTTVFVLVDDKYGFSILGVGLMDKFINHVVHRTFGIILGFLIVYQANQSNARWWEARLAWEAIITHTKEAMRIFCCHCNGRLLIKLYAKYLIAFSVTSMHYLRFETYSKNRPCPMLANILPPKETDRLYKLSGRSRPLACLWACQCITEMAIEKELLFRRTARDINPRFVRLADELGACERILYTPMPWVYTLHLRFVMIAFLVITPLAMFDEDPLPGLEQLYVYMACLSYTFLGLEDIASNIQNPFGFNSSSLPLEIFVHAAYRDVKEIISMKYQIYNKSFTDILSNLGQYDFDWVRRKYLFDDEDDDDDGGDD